MCGIVQYVCTYCCSTCVVLYNVYVHTVTVHVWYCTVCTCVRVLYTGTIHAYGYITMYYSSTYVQKHVCVCVCVSVCVCVCAGTCVCVCLIEVSLLSSCQIPR